MDILYGRNPVLEALRSGRPARKLVIAEGVREEPRLREILDIAASRDLQVEETFRRRLDDITHNEHHQGVAGYFHSRPQLHLDEVIDTSGPPQLLIVLDGIQDPHNLGALTRTADAVGASAVLIPKHRAATVTPAAVKASAGATEHVRVAMMANTAHALERLGDAGFLRVGLAADADARYDEVDYSGPVAIVVGAEGEGMRPVVRRACDTIVSIPMVGHVSSLNATVAGSILMYEVARQRGFGGR